MVHSLLCVCLMCCNMGVGANAPTPIYDNRPQTKKQYANEQDTESWQNFSTELNPIMNSANETIYYENTINNLSAEDDYATQNSFTTFTPTNQNINANVKLFNNEYYQNISPLGAPNDVWAFEYENYIQNYQYWNVTAMLIYKIDGNQKGFSNVVSNIDWQSTLILNNNNQRQFSGKINIKIDTYISTNTDIESIYQNNNFTFDLSNTYQRFINGDLTLNSTNYTYNYQINENTEVGTLYPVDDTDITLITNKTNYICSFFTWRIAITEKTETQFDQNYYNTSNITVTTYSKKYETRSANLWSNFNNDAPNYIKGQVINLEFINYEVVDIPGMLWEILTMPFAFISQAFNLTLFPGTPYQINISQLILTIFGILVFTFILKLLLKR